MSSTALAVSAAKAAASIVSPRSRLITRSISGLGRGRLPVCVVRIRSLLVFMRSFRCGGDYADEDHGDDIRAHASLSPEFTARQRRAGCSPRGYSGDDG